MSLHNGMSSHVTLNQKTSPKTEILSGKQNCSLSIIQKYEKKRGLGSCVGKCHACAYNLLTKATPTEEAVSKPRITIGITFVTKWIGSFLPSFFTFLSL